MGVVHAIAGLFAVLSYSRAVLSFVPAAGLKVTGASTRVNDVSCSFRCRRARPLAVSPSDDINEVKRAGFITSENDGEEEEVALLKAIDFPFLNSIMTEVVAETGRAKLQTVNKRLLAQIEEQSKGIVITAEEDKKIKRREEDLNGVNPLYAFLGAGGAAAMSYGSWRATLWLAQKYYSSPTEDSNILAVARLTSFLKQAVVGFFSLGTGIFGVTALGMGIMAGIVAVGVAKGELDPSPQTNTLKKMPAGSTDSERGRLLSERTKEKLRQVDEEIEREIGGKF